MKDNIDDDIPSEGSLPTEEELLAEADVQEAKLREALEKGDHEYFRCPHCGGMFIPAVE